MTKGGFDMWFLGWQIVPQMDHVAVYKDGKFQFSADTVTEAKDDILAMAAAN